MNILDENEVIMFESLSSDNYYIMEVNNFSIDKEIIHYLGDNYLIKSRVPELDNTWILILYKISTHENEDKYPIKPNYEEGYCSCPSCGYFDVDPNMNSCPQCDQEFDWR